MLKRNNNNNLGFLEYGSRHKRPRVVVKGFYPPQTLKPLNPNLLKIKKIHNITPIKPLKPPFYLPQNKSLDVPGRHSQNRCYMMVEIRVDKK